MIQAFAFYLFAVVIVASAAMTILARNPVHSVLWLILAFFNGAALMLTLGAEFIALLLVIVYVGAVAVLFLFVVMMLDIDFAELRSGFTRYAGIGAVLGLVLIAEIIFAVGAWNAGVIEPALRAAPAPDIMPNIQALGTVLYSRYLYVFEAAGLVLLVAMIGAIVLTTRERSGVLRQKVSEQVRRKPGDAIRMTRPGIGEGVEL
ncbi:MAG: NADH-quinone oxidoreductase subunit J [Sphingomonadaceae bacterium]